VRFSVCWAERVAGCSGRCVKLGEVIQSSERMIQSEAPAGRSINEWHLGHPARPDPSCTSAPSRPHPSEAAETACQRFARNRLSDSSSWTVTLALPTAGIVWSHHNPLGAPPGC
jgi:hypothetical protein